MGVRHANNLSKDCSAGGSDASASRMRKTCARVPRPRRSCGGQPGSAAAGIFTRAFGVHMARRAGIRRSEVLNTLSADGFRAAVHP